MTLRLDVAAETWRLARPFVISRGTKTEAHVVVVTLSDGTHSGRGECVPYGRYGETVASVVDAIRSVGPIGDRTSLQSALPPGAARNAYDCALWDLEAKRAGRRVHELIGAPLPRALLTASTLSLGTPSEMAEAAASVGTLPLLKLKLGGDLLDAERMAAVRAARPDARLVADANEAWPPELLSPLLAAAAAARFELIEQPLPAGADAMLAGIPHAVPICADESVHAHNDLSALAGRYDAVNIKLDKAGGLTEALIMADAVRTLGLKIMVGCMVSTSLAMAPATLIAERADWVDLDGPLLLAHDREHGLAAGNGLISPPSAALWG